MTFQSIHQQRSLDSVMNTLGCQELTWSRSWVQIFYKIRNLEKLLDSRFCSFRLYGFLILNVRYGGERRSVLLFLLWYSPNGEHSTVPRRGISRGISISMLGFCKDFNRSNLGLNRASILWKRAGGLNHNKFYLQYVLVNARIFPGMIQILRSIFHCAEWSLTPYLSVPVLNTCV